MKKSMLVLSAIFLAALLTACAASGPASGTKVKCPACGHDFNYVENPETGK
jgi:ABC-type oligopeptide transport system substrate-binding subunit